MDHSAGLEVLALQPVGEGNCVWLRRSWLNRLLLLLLLLLLLHLLLAQLRLMLCHGLLSHHVDVFRNSHAGFLCLGRNLALDLRNLLGRGLLARWWHPRWGTLGISLRGTLRRPLRLRRCFCAHLERLSTVPEPWGKARDSLWGTSSCSVVGPRVGKESVESVVTTVVRKHARSPNCPRGITSGRVAKPHLVSA